MAARARVLLGAVVLALLPRGGSGLQPASPGAASGWRQPPPQCLVDTMASGGFFGGGGLGSVPKDCWRTRRARKLAGTEEAWQRQLLRNRNPELEGIETWAHVLDRPEKGCVLLAQPRMFSSDQSYFVQSVIFVAEHNPDGTIGVILNRPTDYKLGEVADVPVELANVELHFGGDVGNRGTLQMIHPCGDVKNAKEVIPGVFTSGDVFDAANRIRLGFARPAQFRFFVQAAGWSPGQLQAEIDAGVWHCVATSPSVVLKRCWRLPKSLWQEVMELLGDQYAIAAERDMAPISLQTANSDSDDWDD